MTDVSIETSVFIYRNMTNQNNILNELFNSSDRKIKIAQNKKNFYVNNDELHNEIVKCKKLDECSPKLAAMFKKLAYRVSFMPAFRYDNEDDRNDCVQHAILVMMTNFRDFDETRGTQAFSFFTTTAMNGLRAGWNVIKKNSKNTIRFDMIFNESV
ncbi:gp112 [Sphingomonas phage PAU]|uniref:gp112 n=1 Tax=Sphingomonas phage PAU TaxID=1150991 RepID=UPI0002573263|nr:gp112 [Sphingomonas phage PAU]AFF28110.1 gp112 [Sphingomonas phage PAU]